MTINGKSIDTIPELLFEAKTCVSIANKHSKKLDGNNHYARRFIELKAISIPLMKSIEQKIGGENLEAQEAVKEISNHLEDFFKPDSKNRPESDKKITFIYKSVIEPIMVSKSDYLPNGDLFSLEIISNTRGYIEEISKQANGCFEKGWFDACAVMVRRLLETLIIECYEKYNIADSIKGKDGNFFFLRDLIDHFLNETKWNLSRNTKSALPKLKEIGDLSAHSRRYVAKKQDITKIQNELRIVIQELVYIADFKNTFKKT